MCKYCENLFSGEANEELVIVTFSTYDDSYVIPMFIAIDKDEAYIKSYVLENGEEIMDDTDAIVKIKYCPICGRKLTRELD